MKWKLLADASKFFVQETVTVWCVITWFGIIRPYIFEASDGTALRMTSTWYVSMLQNFVTLELHHKILNKYGFSKTGQQFILPEHQWMFHGSHFWTMSSLEWHVPWPPRSSYLSACDFFLSGYLKIKVYIYCPLNIVKNKFSQYQQVHHEEWWKTCTQKWRNVCEGAELTFKVKKWNVRLICLNVCLTFCNHFL